MYQELQDIDRANDVTPLGGLAVAVLKA